MSLSRPRGTKNPDDHRTDHGHERSGLGHQTGRLCRWTEPSGEWMFGQALGTVVGTISRLPPTRGGTLRVFISWSGARSRAAAKELAEWLELVTAGIIEPWMSDNDLDKGSR